MTLSSSRPKDLYRYLEERRAPTPGSRPVLPECRRQRPTLFLSLPFFLPRAFFFGSHQGLPHLLFLPRRRAVVPEVMLNFRGYGQGPDSRESPISPPHTPPIWGDRWTDLTILEPGLRISLTSLLQMARTRSSRPPVFLPGRFQENKRGHLQETFILKFDHFTVLSFPRPLGSRFRETFDPPLFLTLFSFFFSSDIGSVTGEAFSLMSTTALPKFSTLPPQEILDPPLITSPRS